MSVDADHAPHIVLSEYQNLVVDLNSDDVDYLLRRTKIRVEPAVGQNVYTLNPGPNAGVVMLPSGIRLECHPKVGIENFFYMLAVTFDLDPSFLDEIATFQRIDEVFEFVIRYFAELVDQRIRDGLFRSYRDTEENLAVVRGKISFSQDLRLNHVQRHRTYCQFSEFTWDIAENQIIRQVVDVVRHWVTKPELRGELLRIDRLLGEVTPTQHPSRVIDRFAYHRLNDDYRPIHRLCKLFMDGSTISENDGLFEFRTFLFDMNVLFEAFIYKALLPLMPVGFDLSAQDRMKFDVGQQINVRPDLVFRRHRDCVLIADTKYSRIAPDDHHHNALYQVLGYAVIENIDRAALIYPRHELLIDDLIHVRNSPVAIRRLSVDLQLPRAELERELQRLAASLLALIEDSTHLAA